MGMALLVKITRSHGAAARVELDFVNVGVRADFAAPGTFGHANGGHERTGFRANFAAKAEAVAALDPGAQPRSRLGEDGHRRRERMPAELASGALKKHARGFYRQGRHRIRLRTRRIE